jgi:glycosyltransferase involved in cell wall biosynthesis
MTLPRVTICMPVFNGGHYFEAALRSALAQDYENIEVLVVNDGSTDAGETERIALAHGDRVRYIHQENRGVAGALNTAITNMSGDYFAWLSHDDLHLPHKTSAQIAFLGGLGRPDACLFSDYDLIGPRDEPIATARLPVERIRQNPRLPLYNGMINGCTLLIPAGIMREFGPFDEALRATQDYDLWSRILARHEFFHQPEVLVRYRLHPDQGTQSNRAVTEGNVLWKAMLDKNGEIERVQMFGSTHRYFASLGTFLDTTPYPEAASYAHVRAADATGEDTLVSVVIPFFNEMALTVRATRSALDQTHRRLEVVLVDDGSTEDVKPLVALAKTEPRVRLLRQSNAGPSAARNRGLDAARGNYIAFLDADDLFVPLKIERQLGEMQRHGALFSHTSYYVSSPDRRAGLGLSHSGRFDGACYPRIIGSCPIATPTVMIHRSLVDEGFAFSIGTSLGEDVLAWIDLAMRYTLLGIDEPLSIVERSDQSAAVDPVKQVLGLSGMIQVLKQHQAHSLRHQEINQLQLAIHRIGQDWVAGGRKIETVRPRGDLAEAEYPAHPAFPAGGNGRVPPIRVRLS